MLPATVPEFLFVLSALICAIAQMAVVRAALAGRTPASSTAPLAPAREFIWILLPATLLVVVLVWTWNSLPGHEFDPPATQDTTSDERPRSPGQTVDPKART